MTLPHAMQRDHDDCPGMALAHLAVPNTAGIAANHSAAGALPSIGTASQPSNTTAGAFESASIPGMLVKMLCACRSLASAALQCCCPEFCSWNFGQTQLQLVMLHIAGTAEEAPDANLFQLHRAMAAYSVLYNECNEPLWILH